MEDYNKALQELSDKLDSIIATQESLAEGMKNIIEALTK